MKKDTKIYLALVIIVIAIIAVIIALKPNQISPEERAIQCIGENSILYASKTCAACRQQKNLFGEHYDLLTQVDCFKDSQICRDKLITAYPTWIINEKRYTGVQPIEKLKELTGC